MEEGREREDPGDLPIIRWRVEATPSRVAAHDLLRRSRYPQVWLTVPLDLSTVLPGIQ